ncbi:MAG: tetratricopeptide repeat protein, partial [Chloroflexota bacterium]|nr:tetratricopeptide repeat protein [Chloroflexota bacterium]
MARGWLARARSNGSRGCPRAGGRTGDVVLQVGAILEVASVARWIGDVDVTEEWLGAAEHLLRQHGAVLSDAWQLRGRVEMLRGVCLAIRGHPAEARETFESAEHLLAQHGTSREFAMVLGNLGKLCSRVGDYAGAQRALRAASTHWRLLGDQPSMLMTQTILGNLYLRVGKLEDAGSVLLGALEVARHIGAMRAEAYLVDSLGAWHRANGRRGEAARYLREGIRLADDLGERELLISSLWQRAEVALLEEDAAQARDLLNRASAEAKQLGSTLELAALDRALGRLHLAEGRPQQALVCFDSALQRGGTTWGPDERVTTLYWLGIAYLRLGLTWQAQETLRQALAILDQVGGPSALALPAAEDPALLRHGRRSGLDEITLGAVERLVAVRASLSSTSSDVGVGSAPATGTAARELPSVQARLFGTFRLLRDGDLVNTGGRHVDRTGELFALLVLHPDGMLAREIASLLWPGMALNRGQHNLRMTAYLLRRLLGHKSVLRYSAEAYQLEPQLDLWADVRAFDGALARAHVSHGEAAVQAIEEALSLHHGRVLSEVDSEWVETFRMTYASRFVAAALRLAELTHDAARSDAVVEQVLAIEPDNESAHERLIRSAQA